MLTTYVAPFSKVMSYIAPIAAASGALYYLQRGAWPLGHTLNNEWYTASEQYMMHMPRQASDKPVRMNPWSQKINMHSVTY